MSPRSMPTATSWCCAAAAAAAAEAPDAAFHALHAGRGRRDDAVALGDLLDLAGLEQPAQRGVELFGLLVADAGARQTDAVFDLGNEPDHLQVGNVLLLDQPVADVDVRNRDASFTVTPIAELAQHGRVVDLDDEIDARRR